MTTSNVKKPNYVYSEDLTKRFDKNTSTLIMKCGCDRQGIHSELWKSEKDNFFTTYYSHKYCEPLDTWQVFQWFLKYHSDKAEELAKKYIPNFQIEDC